MARFFAFFALFHLSLTFFRPEVSFKSRMNNIINNAFNNRNGATRYTSPTSKLSEIKAISPMIL